MRAVLTFFLIMAAIAAMLSLLVKGSVEFSSTLLFAVILCPNITVVLMSLAKNADLSKLNLFQMLQVFLTNAFLVGTFVAIDRVARHLSS